MVKDWNQKYMLNNNLDDIENNELKQVHEKYSILKGQIRNTKNTVYEQLDKIYNNFINPARFNFWFNYFNSYMFEIFIIFVLITK